MLTKDFLIIIFVILAILIFLVGFLVFQIFQLKKRLNLFFKKGEENLEEVLINQIKRIEKQEKDLEKIFEEISRLNEISKRSFQKIGIVRFNPFKDVGGNQSFSIALLDNQNNGLVITSFYGRQENRIYAKPINQGNSSYQLSIEEKEAINRAITS